MILCKLTDQNLQTYTGFQWTPGEWAPELSGKKWLCSNTIYHCYEHPLLAVLLIPIHGIIKDPRLWLIEVRGEPITDHGIRRGYRSGYRSMRLTEEIPLPEITTEQRVTFAIHCALSVYSEPDFVAWAEKWLSGEDRSSSSARFAYDEAEAWAAAEVGSSHASEWAASSAAEAAIRLTWVEQATDAAWLARAEEASAWSAAGASKWAAEAAAENNDISFDLIAIAERVIK